VSAGESRSVTTKRGFVPWAPQSSRVDDPPCVFPARGGVVELMNGVLLLAGLCKARFERALPVGHYLMQPRVAGHA